MKTVCIDPGHGGPRTGAVGPNKTKESDINLAVALKLKDLAKEQYNIVMTRDIDTMIVEDSVSADLKRRAEIANEQKADLFLSIHCNQLNPLVKGIETWYHNLVTPKRHNVIEFNKRFAMLLYDELHKALPGHNKRGVHKDTEMYASGFGVLRPLEMPAALVELEFLSNADMEKALADPDTQEAIAKALLTAITQFLEG
jgi:N-acetylmuramoyl-L-alanine amidase